MYINKGIYTYIPIPEPETPKPESRTGLPGHWRTIVRVIFLPVQKPAEDMIIYRKKDKKRGVAGATPRTPKARCPIIGTMYYIRDL